MPETIDETVPATKKRNERTEAKFFESAERIIAEAEREGAEYQPPNDIAKLIPLKAEYAAALAQRTLNQQKRAAEEAARNARENLYSTVKSDVSRLTAYAKSAGRAANDIDALKAVARDVSGRRAKPKPPANSTGGAPSAGGESGTISVSQQSYAGIADSYSRFIEQYDTLAITTEEAMYRADTHRDKLDALRQSNTGVINAVAASNTSGEALDRLAYTDADSLLNACVSAKQYIKSKYGTTGEAYKNISGTRFEIPSRLR